MMSCCFAFLSVWSIGASEGSPFPVLQQLWKGRLRKREEDVGKDVRESSLKAWAWERALT